VKLSNIKQFKKFFSEMLNAGIYIAPSAFEAMFVSLAHSPKDIEHTIDAAKYSFKRIK
jgi:glutamate-1-semialdehyde 2,1-aminomutase